MITKSQDRLLGLALVALLATVGGELLGSTPLLTTGVTGFFLAVAGLFVLMTVTLVVAVGRSSGPDMRPPIGTDRARVSTASGDR